MRVSVILSTYNSPAWLEKVIWGYCVQTHDNFELVVADDGSSIETAKLLQVLAYETGLDIDHVWHEDIGFRKCTILNKAILRANSDYLVFSDGDCIPRRDFLANHVRFARQGVYLSGGLVRLSKALSEKISYEDIITQRAMRVRWLARHGMPMSRRLLKMLPGCSGTILDQLTTTKPTWNGHNASGWKKDLIRINGFDERMEYGAEDCELGERLVNVGVRPRQIRHRAVCLHLEHSRGYVNPLQVQWNKAHRRAVRRNGVTWTEYGIRKQAQPPLRAYPPVLGPERQPSHLKAA